MLIYRIHKGFKREDTAPHISRDSESFQEKRPNILCDGGDHHRVQPKMHDVQYMEEAGKIYGRRPV